MYEISLISFSFYNMKWGKNFYQRLEPFQSEKKLNADKGDPNFVIGRIIMKKQGPFLILEQTSEL